MGNTPKTIYKTNGVEVTLVDTSKEVKKAIEKLSKEALGASAKVIRKKNKGRFTSLYKTLQKSYCKLEIY